MKDMKVNTGIMRDLKATEGVKIMTSTAQNSKVQSGNLVQKVASLKSEYNNSTHNTPENRSFVSDVNKQIIKKASIKDIQNASIEHDKIVNAI